MRDDASGGAYRYAGFWRRLAAWLIDWMILKVLLLALALPYAWLRGPASLPTSAINVTPILLAFSIGGVAAYWAYSAIPEQSRWQATPGKLLLRLRVTSLKGERISLAVATLRTWPHWSLALVLAFRAVNDQYLEAILLGLLFLAVGLSGVAVAFTARRQGLHDLLARTLIVRV